MNGRLIKIFFSCAVGLYMMLVCFNNIFDYGSNFQFVHMVTKMEDIFSKERNSWRSVHSVFFKHLMFILIITWELATAILILSGATNMIRKYKAPATEFKQAKWYVSAGLSLGVLLWFTVFIAVGGEWFLMWQSKSWNAQQTAFHLTCCFLLFLIHHNQEDI
jgi:predicted small integral membrane protein